MKTTVDYPAELVLEDTGHPVVFSANGSHGVWAGAGMSCVVTSNYLVWQASIHTYTFLLFIWMIGVRRGSLGILGTI